MGIRIYHRDSKGRFAGGSGGGVRSNAFSRAAHHDKLVKQSQSLIGGLRAKVVGAQYRDIKGRQRLSSLEQKANDRFYRRAYGKTNGSLGEHQRAITVIKRGAHVKFLKQGDHPGQKKTVIKKSATPHMRDLKVRGRFGFGPQGSNR